MPTTIETQTWTRVRKFVADLTKLYAKKYKTENNGKDLKKDPDLYPLLTFQIGKDKKAGFRSGADQGYLLAQRKAGKTKVCWSAHMKGGARHVPVKMDGKIASSSSAIKARIGQAGLDEFKKNWVDTMRDNDLVNGKGNVGWYSADAFHLEHPRGRPAKGDPETLECILAYVEEVGEDYTRVSPELEADNWAKREIKKVRTKLNIASQSEMEAASRDEQLSAMEFESRIRKKLKQVKGKGHLFAGAKKSTKVRSEIKQGVQPPADVIAEVGRSKSVPRVLSIPIQFDDIGVTLDLKVSVDFAEYKLLPQRFITSALVAADLTVSKDAPPKLKAKASFEYTLDLKKNDTDATALVNVNYHIDAPGRKQDKKGKVEFFFVGSKSGKVQAK